MEINQDLLKLLKGFENQNIIALMHIIKGIITDVEEIEFMKYRLDIKIDETLYNGIYIDLKRNDEIILKKDYVILMNCFELIKKERNFYIYTNSSYSYISDDFIDNEQNKIIEKVDIMNIKKENIIDLNPNSFIEIMKSKFDVHYESDIFIYKKNNELHILISIINEQEFILGKNLMDSNSKDFIKFLSKEGIKNNNLIIIDNYIITKEGIKFNDLTLFNLVKLEYIDEYFKKKLNPKLENIHLNNNEKKILVSQKISQNQDNILLIKVVYIEDKFLLGIDYSYNIFKLYKDLYKFKEIIDVFAIIFIKNFKLSEEDSIYNLILNNNSYVHVFENTFNNILLNDLTIIKFHYLDFKEPSTNNYYNKIGIDDDLSFQISKRSEYFILFIKFDLSYNYYPHKIKLISNNNKEIHWYKILLYSGLLNNVNCLINYTEADKYGYEYFYYSFYDKLPKFHNIMINNDKYTIENFDNFNSNTRKRFILLNYYDKENNYRYNIMKDNDFEIDKKLKRKANKPNKEKKDEEKHQIISDTNEMNDNDININEEESDINDFPIETSHNCIQFCFLCKDNEEYLFGIYEIDEIERRYIPEKKIIFDNNDYKIFYDFYNLIKDDPFQKIDSFEKFKDNDNIKNLVEDAEIDFSTFNYQSYIIYINLCLFYYLNKAKIKTDLIEEFKNNFNLLSSSNLSYRDRIRIIRFICKEQIKIAEEDRRYTLLILDLLDDKNSYKIAINYNKNIIKNLEESSKLYIAFLQLDSYILYNFNIRHDGYTLSLEPLIITKAHLLTSYDNFLFITKEKAKKDNTIVYAYQCTRNDITIINDYGLFPSINNRNSDKLKGNNYAVPISAELIHERNGHSKKDKKNKRRASPFYFYTRSSIKLIDVKFQETINKNDKNEEIKKGETGLLVEYFIKYKKKNLSQELKQNLGLGNIMNDVKFFTSKTFEYLNKEINDSSNKNIININYTSKSIGHSDEQKFEIIINKKSFEKDEFKKPSTENKSNSQDISYYENKYLREGKYFVYPDSIPIIYRKYNEENSPLPQGLIDYLQKYKDAINDGRKKHYGY